MKNDVDTRVVRMEFDNKQFEKNVKKSTKSIDNLKQTLDFKGVGESIDKVKVKFSALQVAATTAIAAITTKVVNLGVTLIKSLSVDNIATGWAKYGEKTIAVATMMAQKIRIAGEEISDLAMKTEVVNEQLEKLTWFSDETSYSFTDMTNYVGKFIAAGQDLDKSVKAMEGIATWAALAGQNSQTASRAMMQLAQAMGRSINRQDWSSIQTANMDMEEFREKALETAVALGELTKEGDKFVTKTGKKFDKSGFVNYLSEGWFTAEVLVETLNEYSAAVDEIYEISVRTGKTATEVLEEYGDQFDEFAVKAFRAAQEARTFNDVINAVKDAVSSKWMTTFETIFGNKDESVKLWSKLANELYDAFAESGNFRNNVLAAWKEMGGREDIFGEDGAFWNLYYAIIAIRDVVKEAWNIIFPITEMEDENDQAKDIARTIKAITKQINDFTKKLVLSEKAAQRLSKIFRGLFSVVQVAVFALRAIRYVLDPILYTLKALANQTLNRLMTLTGGISNILEYIYNLSNKLNTAVWNLIKIINPAGILNKFFNLLSRIWNIIVDYNPIVRLTNFVEELFEAFSAGGGTVENLSKIFKGVISLVSIVGKVVIQVAKVITQYVLPILDEIIDAIGYIVGFISGIAVSIVAAIADIFTVINNALEGTSTITDVGDSLKSFLNFIPQALTKMIPILQALWIILKSLVDVILLIPRLLDSISTRLTGKGIIDNITYFFDNFSQVIEDFVNGVKSKDPAKVGSLQGLFQALIFVFESLGELLKGLIATAQWLLTVLGTALRIIGKALQKIAETIIAVFSGKWKELTAAQRNMFRTVVVLGGLVLVGWALWSVFWRLINVFNPLGSIADSFVNVLDKFAINALTIAINTIASAFLKFAAALWLLNKVDKQIVYTILYVGGIVGGILALAFFVRDIIISVKAFEANLNDSIDEIKEGIKASKQSKEVYTDLAKIISTVGNLLLKIVLAAAILDKLDAEKNSFARVIGLLGIISGMMLLFMIASRNVISVSGKLTNTLAQAKFQSSEISASFKDFAKILAVLGGFLVLIAGVAAIFDKLYFVEDSIKAISLVLLAVSGAIFIISVSLRVLNSKTKVANKTANKSNKILLQLSLMITSISGLLLSIAGALSIIAAIPVDSMVVARDVLQSMTLTIALVLGILALMAGFSKTKIGSGIGDELIKFAISIETVSLALLTLAGALRVLEGLSLDDISSGLNKIFISIGLFVAIALIAQKVAPIMLLISSALLLIGAAAYLTAEALDMFIDSCDRLNNVDTSGLINFAQSIGDAIAKVLPGIAEGLSAILKVIIVEVTQYISDTLLIITDTVHKLVLSVIQFIIDSTYMIIDAVNTIAIKAIESLMNIIRVYGVPLGVLVVETIIKIMEYVASQSQRIFNIINTITFTGLMMLLDYLIANISPIITKVVELMHSIISGVISNINMIRDDTIAFAKAILDLIVTIIPELISAIIAAVKTLVVNMWNNIMEAFGADGARITEEKLNEFMNNIMGSLVKVFDIISEVIARLGPLLGNIIDIIANLLVELKPLIDAVIDFIYTIFSNIDWVSILEFVGEVVKSIAEVLDMLAPVISSILAPILKLVLTILTAIVQAIAPFINILITVLQPFLDTFIVIIELIAGVLGNVLGPVLQTIIQFVGALLQSITALFTGDWSGVVDNWSQIWSQAFDSIKQAWSGFGDKWNSWWNEFWENNKEKLIQAYYMIIGHIKEFITHISTILYNTIKMTLTNARIELTKAWNWVKSAFNTIKNFFINLTNKFVEFGKNLVLGIRDGIQNGWETIKNGVTDVGNKIKDWFKNMFGIHSPSTVFANYGEWMMKGLVVGLEDGLNNQKDKINDVCSQVMSNVEDILMTDEDDIVLSVGLDLSNVEAGAAQARDIMTSIGSGVANTSFGYNANKVVSEVNHSKSKRDSDASGVTNNTSNNTTNNNVFNITSTNPKEAADEIDKILQEKAKQAKLARGGI